MRKAYLLAIISCMLFAAFIPQVASAANNHECTVLTTQQVSNLFKTWNNTLKTKNPDAVTALYATNAVLLPTVSNTPRADRAAIRSYFVKFLQKSPSAVIDSDLIRTGCGWATDTGLYTFQLTNEEGKTSSVQARFSYTYELIDGKWLIISHHSSFLPEGKKESI